MSRINPIIVLISLMALVSCQSSNTKLNSNSWRNYYQYAVDLLNLQKGNEALIPLEKSYDLLKKSKSISNKNFGKVSQRLCSLYLKKNRLKDAVECCSLAIKSIEVNKKTSLPKYSDLLYSVGKNYRNLGYLESSISIFNKRLKIIEDSKGILNNDYANTLNSLSIVLKRNENYQEAIEVNELYGSIRKELFGPNSRKLSQYYNNLSQIYFELGNYNEALKKIEMGKSLFPKEAQETRSFANLLYTQSIIYKGTNDFDKEIELLKKCAEIYSKSSKRYYNRIMSINNNLAVAYDNKGDYQKAIELKKIVLDNTNTDDSNYPVRLQNLAYAYNALGDFQKAEYYYDMGVKACIDKFGRIHSNYAQLIDAKGQMHLDKGEYLRAEVHFKEALAVLDSIEDIKQTHSEYGFYLNNYARSLLAQNKYKEAIVSLENSIELYEKNKIQDPIRFYRKQHDLSRALLSIGNYKEALTKLNSIHEDFKVQIGETHPDYGVFLKTYGDAYLANSNIIEALKNYKKANDISITEIEKVFRFRSEKENKNFIETLKPQFQELQTLELKENKLRGILTELNLNNQFLLKNLLLSQSKRILEKLSSLNDSIIKKKLYEYKQLKSEAIGRLAYVDDLNLKFTDSISEQLNIKEAELVKFYNQQFRTGVDLAKDWVKSKQYLEKDAIAIEFSNFKFWNENNASNSDMYVAYLYKNNWQSPKMIPLFKGEDLKTIIKNKSPEQLYKTRGSKAKSRSNMDGLYKLIWYPLERELDSIRTIFFSPSGLLNQIPIAALVSKNGNRVIDNYNLIQLSSTSKIPFLRKSFTADSTLFLGGVEYNYTVKDSVFENKSFYTKDFESFKSSKNSLGENEVWNKLPGTLKEINNITRKFLDKSLSFEILTSDKASERAFKNLDGNSPKVIHIATHGFFYENIEDKINNSGVVYDRVRYTYAKDPLLRSGLILAGGNFAWQNGINPFEEEDGILTSLEISNLDLSKTQMVILSACDTGLGDIDGSEGVYGLQRAFKKAGVDIIIMSLWEVPDKETAEFMELFYDNWINGLNFRNAFQRAQIEMSNKYREEPAKWAAFVLFE